jgi:hypothetical protein
MLESPTLNYDGPTTSFLYQASSRDNHTHGSLITACVATVDAIIMIGRERCMLFVLPPRETTGFDRVHIEERARTLTLMDGRTKASNREPLILEAFIVWLLECTYIE